MSLLDRSLKYLSVALFAVLAVWAVIFYLDLREEVYESVDEGLKSHKRSIIHRAKSDASILLRTDFSSGDYAMRPVDKPSGKKPRDVYKDTVLYIPSEGEVEPVRLLTTTFKLDDRHYRMQVYASTVEEDDLIKSLLWSLVGLYTALLLAVVIINKVLLRRIWQPFHTILEQLKGFRLGVDRKLADVPSDLREFQELKRAADALVDHATNVYDGQRAFTENAAHELQTPLAIGINKLELLAESGGLDGAQTEAVAEVIGTLQRSVRLNRSLLLLARIENKQFHAKEPVDLGALVKSLADDLEALAEHRGVQVRITHHAPLIRTMDPGLAQVLLTNLLKNAIVHNKPQGMLAVEVDEHGLVVSNTGVASALDAPAIFERFRKETKREGGTGLGLAIAKAVATSYGFTLTYRFTDVHRMELRC